MGAATAIMYGASDPSIAGMVLDSPFTSLKQLSKELVNSTNVGIFDHFFYDFLSKRN